MIFLVTSNFRNTHPVLGDQLTRLNDEPGTHELQYDAGEFISIGRDANGNELNAGALAGKNLKSSKPVVLIGHLNQGGRLLDPYTQQLDCAKCCTEAAAAVKKQYKALITHKGLLDAELEKDEIAELGKKITGLQGRAKELLKMSDAFLAADKSKKKEDVDAIIGLEPVKRAA